MPAERTKCSRRNGADATELVWTLPVEAPAAEVDCFTFAPTITPVTFDEGPPPLVDAPPSEYILFPPADDCVAPRRAGHSKKKPEDHIPRPPNAFILFRSSFIKGNHVSSEVETNHSTLSKIIGLAWKGLPDGERQFWHSKAKAALDDHKRKFPQYAFRPNQGRGKGNEKRKVREVGPKDHKRCAKIAELLVEGKKGQDLHLAVQEFDKHHVPEIVTRFEAPITARSFRRSSSAPIPDADESKSRFPRKSRSSSTRPSSPATSFSPMSLPSSCPSFAAKQENHFEAFEMPAFDQFSFTSQPTPFDLDTFSFDNHSSPMSFTCGPLSDPVSPLDCNSMPFSIPDGFSNEVSSPLSPSFIGMDGMDDWNRCPSPFSAVDSSMPTTPSASFPDSPRPDEYGSFPLEAFEQSLTKSFGDFSGYANNTDTSFTGRQFSHPNTTEMATGYGLSTFQPSKVHMATQDVDFSAFMLTEYSL